MRTRMAIADVAGHGMSASMLMASVQTALHTMIPELETADFEAILTPLAGDQPTGVDLRQDFAPTSIYFRLRDARAQARDAEQFRHWDRRFHSAVADASASPHLTLLAKNSLVLTDALRARDVPVAGDAVACSAAIAKGDEDGARRLAVEHVDHVSRNVLAAFAQEQQEADAT